MSNNGYVPIGTHGPDSVKVPHHVHNKSKTVSVPRLVSPDQQKKPTKYTPTGIMEIMIQKNNFDCLSIKKLVIGNSGTKFVIIEEKMPALNSSSRVKGLLVPYENTDIYQQDYAVVPSEHSSSI